MDHASKTAPAPREWLKLKYHDPAYILAGLRRIALQVGASNTEEGVKNLRTNGLKTIREGRQAALFCYGLSQRTGRKIQFALQEPENDAADAIGLMDINGEAFFLPIQLKELPPTHLNPHVSLQDILNKLGSKRSGARGTIVAIHVNRVMHLEISKLTIPTGIAELWLYGAADETQDRWFLIGDLLSDPGLASEFAHPGCKLLYRDNWIHTPRLGAYA
nr:hypothetical protein [uncultured Duganella sp.]